jgi:hypothetical protein
VFFDNKKGKFVSKSFPMDYEKILLYAVLALAYYGYKRFFKNFGVPKEAPIPTTQKKKQVPPNIDPSQRGWSLPSEANTPAQPTSTITDLLEEVKRKQQAYETSSPTLYTSIETVDYDLDPAKATVENVDPYQYKSIDAEEKQKNIVLKEFIFTDRATHKKAHPILNVFKNKMKIREAFVIGELLKNRN